VEAEKTADQAMRHQPLLPHRSRRRWPGLARLYRVHQFHQSRDVAFTLPEQSEDIHNYFRDLECEIFDGLVSYRVLDIATGDLAVRVSQVRPGGLDARPRHAASMAK